MSDHVSERPTTQPTELARQYDNGDRQRQSPVEHSSLPRQSCRTTRKPRQTTLIFKIFKISHQRVPELSHTGR
jgi:hypothetical protein